MFYDLIFHPSGLELRHRDLDEKTGGFKEKKLAVLELSHKFGYDSVEKGEYYEYFKKAVGEILEPHRIAFNSLNIIVAAPFFQFKQFALGLNNLEPELYINWETCKLATDLPEHYVYGFHYDDVKDTASVALTRMTVKNYFSNIVNDLFGSEVKFKLCAFYGNTGTIITLDKKLKDTFVPAGSQAASVTSQAEVSAVQAKGGSLFGKAAIFFIAVIAIAAASFYFFRPQTNGVVADKNRTAEAKVAEIPVKEEIQTTPVAVIVPEIKPADELPAKIAEVKPQDTATIKTEPVKEQIPAEPVSTPKAPQFWNFVRSLTELETDSIVFNQGLIKLYSGKTDLIERVNKLDESGSYAVAEENGFTSVKHSSFILKNYKSASNYDNFIDIKNDHSLFSGNDTYPVGSKKELQDFLSDLGKKKVGIGKFVIISAKDSISIKVSFD
jgi:hypothetical protein